MFTLYCDDSGTHPESDVAVAACYISTAEQWGEFNRNWHEVNEREKFGVFHMADFVGRRAQFALPEWSDQAKRDRTIGALVNVIKTRARIGFAAVVVKSSYDEVIVNGKLSQRFGDNHYAFSVRLCTALVDRWRQKHGYLAPVEYVFDRLSNGKGDINKIFETLLQGGQDAFRRYGICEGCWSFRDKAQVVQLQAADIWAWENYRYMVNTYIPSKLRGLPAKPPRRSYLALIDSPHESRYHIDSTLRELVRRGTEELSI